MMASHDELVRFAVDVFSAAGMTRADAQTVAEVLVWADLRGLASHGVSRIPRYLEFIDHGELDPRARPSLVTTGTAAATVRAGRAAGPVAMVQACAQAVALAKAHGVGFCLVAQTTHTGAIGYYAAQAASAGCAAIVSASGPPNMAYAGARVASVSTAPIAIAVPAEQGAPLLFDMASSIVSAGKIRQARRNGDALPPDAALDREGRPTTDPNAAELALPIGGAKGAGLSLMMELLTGVLAGNAVLLAHLRDNLHRHAQNAFVVALNVPAFRSLDGYCRDVASLSDALHALPRREGVEEIRMPGERGQRTASEQRSAGVRISAKTEAELAAVADRFSIRPIAPRL
jgi:ureidoglycolate dehydrogenase (NAD+)